MTPRKPRGRNGYSSGMNLRSQWGKTEKKNKKPRKGPQIPHAWDAKIENERTLTASQQPNYQQAIRLLQVIALRDSRKRWDARLHERPPRPKVRAMYPVSFADEELFISKGLRALPKDHPFKDRIKLFVPSQPQRIELKQIYAARGLLIP